MECDEKEDIIKRVSHNIKYCINEKGVSQGDLRKKSEKDGDMRYHSRICQDLLMVILKQFH